MAAGEIAKMSRSSFHSAPPPLCWMFGGHRPAAIVMVAGEVCEDPMRTPIFVMAVLAGAAISGQSLALDASGETVGVDPDAEASGAGGLRTIEIKGPIFMGDVITTDVRGQVQILFVDDTRFVVGANSKVTIDAFVFDANKTAQDVSISAVKGAFRFITGNSPKQNYTIKTPTMTIGVRGTAFDLAVRPGNGESTVLTHNGATDICDVTRRCMEGNAGSMVVGSQDGGLHSVPPGRERTQRLSALFPLLASQSGLVQGFQVPAPADLPAGDGDNGPIHNDTGNVPPNIVPPGVQDEPPDGTP
jgi:hypothetical protein